MATSMEHDFIAQLFRPPSTRGGAEAALIQQPRLLALLDPPLPQIQMPSDAQVQMDSEQFSKLQPKPTEGLRGDRVLVWKSSMIPNVVKVVHIEVQFSSRAAKRGTLMDYICMLRSTYPGRPGFLIVIPNSDRVYRWARKPIISGSLTLQASVLVPSRLKRIIDVNEAVENPELTLLALAVHGGLESDSPHRLAQFLAADRAAARVDAPLRGVYIAQLATEAYQAMSANEIQFDSLLTQQIRDQLIPQLREELAPQIRHQTLVQLAMKLLADHFEAAPTPEQTAAIAAATDDQLEVFVEGARALPRQMLLDEALTALSVNVPGRQRP